MKSLFPKIEQAAKNLEGLVKRTPPGVLPMALPKISGQNLFEKGGFARSPLL
jgi:hypothetical protein